MEFQTALVKFKAKNNLLPGKSQKLFTAKEGGQNLRGKFYFKILSVHTTRKSFCISVCGVKLWNSLNIYLFCYLVLLCWPLVCVLFCFFTVNNRGIVMWHISVWLYMVYLILCIILIITYCLHRFDRIIDISYFL